MHKYFPSINFLCKAPLSLPQGFYVTVSNKGGSPHSSEGEGTWCTSSFTKKSSTLIDVLTPLPMEFEENY